MPISLYQHLKRAAEDGDGSGSIINIDSFLENIEINMQISASFSNLLRRTIMIHPTKTAITFPPHRKNESLSNSLLFLVNHYIKEERMLIRSSDRNLLGLGMVQVTSSIPATSLLSTLPNDRDWTLLHSVMGEWNFLFLFLNNSLLIRRSGQLHQISGRPLSECKAPPAFSNTTVVDKYTKYKRHHILYSTAPPTINIEACILERIKRNEDFNISVPNWLRKRNATSRIREIFKHHFSPFAFDYHSSPSSFSSSSSSSSSSTPILQPVTYRQVNQFLHSVLKKILPSYAASQRREVENFVRMRKFECLGSLQPISHMIGCIVIPLLKCLFYITEHGGNGNDKRLHYYPLDLWIAATTPSFDYVIDKLSLVVIGCVNGCTNGCTCNRYKKNNTNNNNNNKKLPQTADRKIRLLPKSDGTFRPISRLTSGLKKSNLKEINVILKSLLDDYGSGDRVSLRGGLGDIDAKIDEYLSVNRTDNYISKFDIKEFYDSIEHQVLLQILQESLSDGGGKDYKVHRYDLIRNGIVKWVRSSKDAQHFKGKGYCVVDRFSTRTFTSYQIIRSIKEHLCTESITLMTPSQSAFRYVQSRGVPQGSPVSASLSAIYYERLDVLFFSSFRGGSCLLMRYVDDVLLITSSYEEHSSFCRKMNDGFGDKFNFSINHGKALLSHPVPGCLNFKVLGTGEAAFPWCGILICKANLACEPDYSSLYDLRYVSNSLYINWSTSIFGDHTDDCCVEKIAKKMSIAWIKSRLSPLFISDRQDTAMLYRIVYRAVTISSMKLCVFLKELKSYTTSASATNGCFLERVAYNLCNYITFLCAKARSDKHPLVSYVCREAFSSVFGCSFRGTNNTNDNTNNFILKEWMWLEEKKMKHLLRY